MIAVGIVCEYNPLHLGHEKQFRIIREHFGTDAVIVCAMSGNFVQRGEPAIFDKMVRAKAAVDCGADLVIELPVTVSLSSAEGFAAGAVAALTPLCDCLCFGTESESAENLMVGAQALLSSEFSEFLKKHLKSGVSFPSARALALAELGIGLDVSSPNNILGLEYCKALLKQGSSMKPYVIHREGSYHEESLDTENPSATAVRRAISEGRDFLPAIPDSARQTFKHADIHLLSSGEKAVLYRLRTMTDAEFENLPFGSEGLWRKLMHVSRENDTLPAIMEAVKSKRYTYTRISRMIMCAVLGIIREMMDSPAPYYRVLAFSNLGRACLARQRSTALYRNIGEKTLTDYEEFEIVCDRVYALFFSGTLTSRSHIKQCVYYRK